jgi:catechol 2,3-dioxygenase-like lactoylglutathione lyase family enzyme
MNLTTSLPLVGALNHAALLTRDLDRFVEFYCGVLALELAFSEDTPQMRHAIVRTGPLSWLHAVDIDPTGGAAAGLANTERPLERGRIDHIALSATSETAFDVLRQRLVACGASDGSVDDLGAFRTLWFRDPDGLRVELTLVIEPSLRGVHAPLPYRPASGHQRALPSR